MSLTVGELVGYLKLDDKDFNKGLDKGEGRFKNFGKTMGVAVAGAAVAAGAAVTAFVGEGVKDFIGFEQQMNEVFTLLPGISDEAMGKMTQDVKEFASEMGVLPEETVPALYQALSAGVPEDNVFAFLETAQKAAVGGVTDLETTVDGITSVVNAYGEDVLDAATASDSMFTAVRLGKTNFEELSASLFNVIPTASALGVKFDDVTAALADMTAKGVPTSVATTQLRQMFVELSKAGSKTSDVFQEVAGKSFKDFIAEGGNTAQAMQMLDQYARQSGLGINDLFGSVEAGSAALSLASDDASGYVSALSEMANAAGATDAAFATMEESMGRKFEKLKAGIESLQLSVGAALLPVVEQFVAFITENMPTIETIMTTFAQVVGVALDGLSKTVVPLLQQAFEHFGSIMETLMPLISSLIEALHPVMEALQKVFEQVWRAIEDIVQAFVDFFAGPTGQALITGLCEGIAQVLEMMSQVFEKVWPLAQRVIQLFIDFWNSASGQKLINTLFDLVGTGLETLGAVFEAVWPLIEAAVDLFLDFFEGVGAPLITGLLDVIVGALNVMKDIWEKCFGALAPFLEKMKGPLEAAFKIMRAPIDALIWLIEKAKDLWNWFTGHNAEYEEGVRQSNARLEEWREGSGTYSAMSRASGGPVMEGMYHLHDDEYVLTAGDTKLMKGLISGLSKGGRGGGGISLEQHNHFYGKTSVEDGMKVGRAASDTIVTRLQLAGAI